MSVDITEDKVDRLKLKLSTAIVQHKEKTGITQSQMASKARTNQPRISQIINGNFYGISIEDLIKINLRLDTGLRLIDLAEK